MSQALVKLFEDPEAAEVFRRSPGIRQASKRQHPSPCQFKINNSKLKDYKVVIGKGYFVVNMYINSMITYF